MTGFCSKQSDGKVPLNEVLQLLREELPSDWAIDHCIYNTKNFGLPHNRPRVYVTGRKTVEGSLVHRFPAKVNCWKGKPTVSDIVRPPLAMEESAPGYNGRGYTPLCRSNVRQWKAALSSQLCQQSCRGNYIFFAYDRTPSSRTTWAPNMSSESCECLTANGPVLHCLSLGDGAKSRDSSVLPSERAALQGFPLDYICNDNRSAAACKAVGNSMSVPVLAAVCFRELFHQLQLRPLLLTDDSVSIPRNEV